MNNNSNDWLNELVFGNLLQSEIEYIATEGDTDLDRLQFLLKALSMAPFFGLTAALAAYEKAFMVALEELNRINSRKSGSNQSPDNA